MSVADPQFPRQLSFLPIPTPNWVEAVAVDGNVAYLYGRERGSDLYSVDVSDAVNPRLIGQLVPLSPRPQMVPEVTPYKDHLYVLSRADGLAIVDVSNPSSPELRHPFTGSHPGGYLLGSQLAFADDHTFLVNDDPYANRPLQVVDVEDPSAPMVQATYRFPNAGDTTGVAVASHWAYLTGRDQELRSGFFRVVDIADVAAPRVVGEVELPFLPGEYPQPVAESDGKHVYVLSPDLIYRIDVTDPTAPRIDGELRRPTGTIRDLAVVGRYGLLADEQANLVILDLSLPDRIEIIDTLPLTHWASALAVSGQNAYVIGGCTNPAGCAEERTLSVIDVSDILHPRRVGSLAIKGALRVPKVVARGDYVFIADYPIQTVDVSDPRQPRLVGEVPMMEDYRRMVSATVDGRFLVVTGVPGPVIDFTPPPCCFQVYDVSDPAQPRYFQSHGYATGGNALSAKLHDGLLYLADGRGGLLTLRLDVSEGTPDPDRPTPSPTATRPPDSTTATPTMAITVIPITPSLTPTPTPTATATATRMRFGTRTSTPTATATPRHVVSRLFLPAASRTQVGD